MKIILQKPVEKLGDPGDVVEVADGYARNYLIPRSLAIRAHRGADKQAETLRRSHLSRQNQKKVEFEALAAKLIASQVTISARAGEEGKLFGSVTAADIAEAIAAQAEIDGRPQGRAPGRADPLARDPRGSRAPVPRRRPGPDAGGHGRGVAATATEHDAGGRAATPGLFGLQRRGSCQRRCPHLSTCLSTGESAGQGGVTRNLGRHLRRWESTELSDVNVRGEA